MRRVIVAASLLVLMTSGALAQMGGGGGPGGGGGMGGGGRRGGGGMGMGKRGGEKSEARDITVKREKLDKVVTEMFREADTNKDGIVTLAEVSAIIEARRETMIRERFQRIDSDHNGAVSLAEFTAWQRQMGSVASSDEQPVVGRNGLIAENIPPRTSDGPEGRVLAMLIEPLSAGTIANANTNYDAGVSLEELLTYEHKRFDAADTDKDGELSSSEIMSLRRANEQRSPGGPGERRGEPGDGPRRCRPESEC